MKVWESALPRHLKPTAGILALFANDYGEKVFPSVARVAWLAGKAERRVTADLTDLCKLGVIAPVTPRTGGGGNRGRTTRYVFVELPEREPWKPRHQRQGSPAANPDTSVRVEPEEPRRFEHETLTSATGTLTPVTANPDAHVTRSVSESKQERLEILAAAPPDDARSLPLTQAQKELYAKVKATAKALVGQSESGAVLLKAVEAQHPEAPYDVVLGASFSTWSKHVIGLEDGAEVTAGDRRS